MTLNGGVLFKIRVFAIEPYMRAHMDVPVNHLNDGDDELFSTYSKGKPYVRYLVTMRILADISALSRLHGLAVAIVIRSDNAKAKPGDHFYGVFRTFHAYFRGDIGLIIY